MNQVVSMFAAKVGGRALGLAAIALACWAPGGAQASNGWSGGNVDALNSTLTSVSCAAPSFCAAVDNAGRVMMWFNSGPWGAPQDIDGSNQLDSVSCASAFCAAVDQAGNVLTFNGSSWGPPDSIDPGHYLEAVSCPTAAWCMAVDDSGRAFNYDGTSWSGPADIDGVNVFSSISCPSSSFCAAVDSSGNAVAFNGTSWGAPAIIDDGPLHSISCPASSFCLAVDDARALTYLSGSWSAPQPIEPSAPPYLTSVSCVSYYFCAAVDDNGNVTEFHEGQWDQPVSPAANAMKSISCVDPSLCAVVGQNGYAERNGGANTTQVLFTQTNSATKAGTEWMGWSFCDAEEGVCLPLVQAFNLRLAVTSQLVQSPSQGLTPSEYWTFPRVEADLDLPGGATASSGPIAPSVIAWIDDAAVPGGGGQPCTRSSTRRIALAPIQTIGGPASDTFIDKAGVADGRWFSPSVYVQGGLVGTGADESTGIQLAATRPLGLTYRAQPCKAGPSAQFRHAAPAAGSPPRSVTLPRRAHGRLPVYRGPRRVCFSNLGTRYCTPPPPSVAISGHMLALRARVLTLAETASANRLNVSSVRAAHAAAAMLVADFLLRRAALRRGLPTLAYATTVAHGILDAARRDPAGARSIGLHLRGGALARALLSPRSLHAIRVAYAIHQLLGEIAGTAHGSRARRLLVRWLAQADRGLRVRTSILGFSLTRDLPGVLN